MVGGVVDGAVEPEDTLDGARLQKELDGYRHAGQPQPGTPLGTKQLDHDDMREEEGAGYEACEHERRGDHVELLPKDARLERHEEDRGVGALPVEPGIPRLLKRGDQRDADVARPLKCEMRPDAIVPVIRIGVVVRADEHEGHENGHQQRDASDPDGRHGAGFTRVAITLGTLHLALCAFMLGAAMTRAPIGPLRGHDTTLHAIPFSHVHSLRQARLKRCGRGVNSPARSTLRHDLADNG